MTPAFLPSDALARDLQKWTRSALAGGILLFVVCIVGAFFSPGDFYHSYLTAFLFFTGITLGCLGVLMMQYLTGGAWGVVSRRTLEAATRTLPLLALLFIPVIFGMSSLYDWSHPDLVARVDVLHHRARWMNPAMFIIRAIVYFAIWIFFAWLLNQWSAEQDAGREVHSKISRLCAPGLIVYVFTVTFSSVDWAESLTTHWYSTMWGFLFVAMQGLATIAFVILVLAALSRREPMSRVLKPVHFHDLGKMLLMFVMLWAYFSFSQLLIVWAGDLTTEISWYIHRMYTSWGWIGGALIVLQFIIPFLLLLSRPLKRNHRLLCAVGGLVLFMRYLELLWIVMPNYYQNGFRFHWLYLAAPLALGGLWCADFLWELGKRPLLPEHAPNLEAALHHVEA
jgi:hypothetical protein